MSINILNNSLLELAIDNFSDENLGMQDILRIDYYICVAMENHNL